MRLFVKAEAYDSIVSIQDVERARRVFGETIQRVTASKTLESGGFFPGMRGGYFVVDVGSAEELLGLLGDIVDFARIELHPVCSFDTLGEFFAKNPPR